MIKKKKESKSPETKEESLFSKEKIVTAMKGETSYFAIGLLLVIFGVYLILAFSSFFFTGGADQSLLEHPEPGELIRTDNQIQNVAGPRGAQLAQFLINDCFGIPAYIIIVFLIVAGMQLMKAYQFNLLKWFIGCSLVMIWFSLALAFGVQPFLTDSFIYPGGLHGYHACQWITSQIGIPGMFLLLLVTAILFALLLTRKTIWMVRKALHPNFSRFRKKQEADVNQPEPQQPADISGSEAIEENADPIAAQPIKKETVSDEISEPETIEEKEAVSPFDEPEEDEEEEEEEEETADTSSTPETEIHSHVLELEPTLTETAPTRPDVVIETTPKLSEPSFEINKETHEEDQAFQGDLTQPYNPRLDLEHYQFPTLDLLNSYDDNVPNIDMEEQNANKDRIIKVLRSFGIEISSIKASVGPTITLYEITPAEGVRISKIRNLEDDIALSLSALGIRIIAPIPGKGTIGIEVPNANPHIVPMSSILSSKKFQETTFDLPVALGKTITNEVFMVDLAKAPHMLVAGATGQGKSVGLNAIVTSLLYKKHPSELKFVIIDPKKVEFAIYAPIERHFLAKLPDGEDAIITDVTKVVQTLNSLCVEMDTRYDLLRKAGCRNIKEYNKKFINRQLNPEKGHHFLPYIVIIIDEFGDLIMTAGKDVELPICRIAQLARAVGIHAIIATQRPTTNIITGTIKANFPARVAFKVASMMDSRTILDRPGAQQLIGKGDMLYLQGNDPVRVQCAFVDTPEVERIANFIGKQQGYPTAFMLPEYVDENSESGSVGDVDMNRLDPLFEEAARLLIYHQQGSTSLIQRKFSIGYNRAGRIMDQLEKAGIVGPTNGSKAREVLCMDENDLDMRIKGLKG